MTDPAVCPPRLLHDVNCVWVNAGSNCMLALSTDDRLERKKLFCQVDLRVLWPSLKGPRAYVRA